MDTLQSLVKNLDKAYTGPDSVAIPEYDPMNHYKDVASSDYYQGLLLFRHALKQVTHSYFSENVGAIDVDLFMLTPSISSPMGLGSDSEPIHIQFGGMETCLVDSSQFGFEPIVMNGIRSVYCYLPSMRGEDPDVRHLNQFYHCELEMACELRDVMKVVEGYFSYLARYLMRMKSVIGAISRESAVTIATLDSLASVESFETISFDDAIKLLEDANEEGCVIYEDSGRDITAKGEVVLSRIMNQSLPFWITEYDRDRVPFYQKPDDNDSNKVLNADLICPPLINDAFGGEVVGAGQRQDSAEQIYESMARQGIKTNVYDWYADLRKMDEYKTTSGFGIGIERLITWLLCDNDIKNATVYPRLKNIKSIP